MDALHQSHFAAEVAAEGGLEGGLDCQQGVRLLTFHETYHAYNPILRFLLERPVHAKISRDNVDTYETALGYAGRVTRLS